MKSNKEYILTKTVAMPADTNTNGDIFGGWLLSQMDGYIELKREEVSRLNNSTHPVEFDMYYSV